MPAGAASSGSRVGAVPDLERAKQEPEEEAPKQGDHDQERVRLEQDHDARDDAPSDEQHEPVGEADHDSEAGAE